MSTYRGSCQLTQSYDRYNTLSKEPPLFIILFMAIDTLSSPQPPDDLAHTHQPAPRAEAEEFDSIDLTNITLNKETLKARLERFPIREQPENWVTYYYEVLPEYLQHEIVLELEWFLAEFKKDYSNGRFTILRDMWLEADTGLPVPSEICSKADTDQFIRNTESLIYRLPRYEAFKEDHEVFIHIELLLNLREIGKRVNYVPPDLLVRHARDTLGSFKKRYHVLVADTLETERDIIESTIQNLTESAEKPRLYNPELCVTALQTMRDIKQRILRKDKQWLNVNMLSQPKAQDDSMTT